MPDWREDRIGSAQRGQNPTVLARMPSSYAGIDDVQWLPGYCVLLVDDPGVQRLSDRPGGPAGVAVPADLRIAGHLA